MLIIFLLILPIAAHAYIDPGTGTYLLNVVLAIMFGATFLLKRFWEKVIGFSKTLVKKINGRKNN